MFDINALRTLMYVCPLLFVWVDTTPLVFATFVTTGWAKNRACLSVGNLATVRGSKACEIISKVSQCCR